MTAKGALHCTLILTALISMAAPVHSESEPTHPEAPKIEAQQKSDAPLKGEQEPSRPQPGSTNITLSIPNEITVHLNNQAAQKAEGGNEEGTEYWPIFWHLHLKITDSLLALFTLMLVLATGFLGWSTILLWRVTRDEFNATHRPRIRVKHVWLKNDIREGEQVKVDLVIVNSGDAPAIVTQSAMVTLIISKDDTLPNGFNDWIFDYRHYEMSVGLTVSIDNLTDGRILSDSDNSDLRSEARFLYCLGSVDYIDKSDPKKIMKTAFCRKLIMPPQIRPGVAGRTSRFMLHNDPDYEYQD